MGAKLPKQSDKLQKRSWLSSGAISASTAISFGLIPIGIGVSILGLIGKLTTLSLISLLAIGSPFVLFGIGIGAALGGATLYKNYKVEQKQIEAINKLEASIANDKQIYQSAFEEIQHSLQKMIIGLQDLSVEEIQLIDSKLPENYALKGKLLKLSDYVKENGIDATKQRIIEIANERAREDVQKGEVPVNDKDLDKYINPTKTFLSNTKLALGIGTTTATLSIALFFSSAALPPLAIAVGFVGILGAAVGVGLGVAMAAYKFSKKAKQRGKCIEKLQTEMTVIKQTANNIKGLEHSCHLISSKVESLDMKKHLHELEEKTRQLDKQCQQQQLNTAQAINNYEKEQALGVGAELQSRKDEKQIEEIQSAASKLIYKILPPGSSRSQ